MTSPADREPQQPSTPWGNPTPTGPHGYGQQAHGSRYGTPEVGFTGPRQHAPADPYARVQGDPYSPGYAQGDPYANGYSDQYGGYGDPYANRTQPLQAFAPPPAPRRERRRPGWLALTAGMLGSAVAASALTGALVAGGDQGLAELSARPDSGAAAPVEPGTGVTAPDWRKVVSSVAQSVVAVAVSAEGGAGEGSGVVWDDRGRIITNHHVISGGGSGARITVTLDDGRQFAASIVGTDPGTDLAIIEIDNPPEGLKPAVFADSDQVSPGQPVMALGNPLGLSQTATTGIISAVDRPVTTRQEPSDSLGAGGESAVTNAIQTDAAVNPGNSGGALLDSSGRVIGINSSIASLGSASGGTSGSIGLGFAIPSNQAKLIGDQLAEKGTAQHARLGVGLAPRDASVEVDGARRSAAQVAQVEPGTAAAEGGLRDGDAIIAVDGEEVTGGEDLIATIRERAVGQVVTVTVVRDGAREDLEVTLGARPQE
ncbi:putative serine protease PepD [Kineococcus xinjiangensis]|uniref:Putative serine protease PepD n=1 Tax=Kineococcus xinjiangensis TaxID=512762 RepID=A0A2S6IT41_9ACTN|nr:trypsin-like peptidase domain-containing protein [Kineococcus xinjiangensis]PPK97409.1 putative serine protease PepD [Kineococcus xinjiangensis]